jgi:hypothetical protein
MGEGVGLALQAAPRSDAHGGRCNAPCTAGPARSRILLLFRDLHGPCPARSWDPDRPLRIGYISPDLFTHSVSYFAEAPLSHHSPARGFTHIVYRWGWQRGGASSSNGGHCSAHALRS